MKVKSIFLSDLHLGAKVTEHKKLSKFLDDYKAENYFLIGDIIDFWALGRNPRIKNEHLQIIKKIIKLSKKHNVVYIIGNHDDLFRKFDDLQFGNIEVYNEFGYQAVNGKNFLLTHGDLYDGITRNYKIVSMVGSFAYDVLIVLNKLVAKCRKYLKMQPWSFSSYIKRNVKKAASFINNFEELLAAECKSRDYDGVICGHIHKAEIRKIGFIDYLNCGDFLESATAIIENFDGTFEIVDYGDLPDET